MANKLCPYCGSFVEFKDSSVVYGISYGMIYICSNYPKCDAYVGVHKGTNKPLGSLARRYLRELRKECHEKFDTYWKGKGKDIQETREVRKDSYRWLASVMGISRKKAHIAKFDENQCLELLENLNNLTS